jgi:hypothetical protein
VLLGGEPQFGGGVEVGAHGPALAAQVFGELAGGGAAVGLGEVQAARRRSTPWASPRGWRDDSPVVSSAVAARVVAGRCWVGPCRSLR